VPRPAALPDDLTETLIERRVHRFYERVRADAVLGPIFERRIGDRWDAHLAAMTDFWSSVALMTGRYAGSRTRRIGRSASRLRISSGGSGSLRKRSRTFAEDEQRTS
jgi:truncated hemoglobin YjbI